MRKTTLSLLLLAMTMLFTLPIQAQDYTKKKGPSKAKKSPMPTLLTNNAGANKVSESSLLMNKAAMKKNVNFESEMKKKDFSKRIDAKNASKAKKIATATGEQVDENGIITEPAEGSRKIYSRAGTCYYLYSSELYMGEQSGKVHIVECEDGTVYVRDLVSEYGQSTWVKGTKEGNTITIPAGQPVAYSSNYGATMSIRWGLVDEDYNVNPEPMFAPGDVNHDGSVNVTDITLTVDYVLGELDGSVPFFEEEANVNGDDGITITDVSSIVEIVLGAAECGTNGKIIFTIDGDVITLEGSSESRMLCVFWDDDDSWSGYADYETVWTYLEDYVAPTIVTITPPADLVTETWYVLGNQVDGGALADLDGTAQVGFDGNDVYIQGIFPSFPNAWIKGTMETYDEGVLVTFSDFQYQGQYFGLDCYATGFDGEGLTDFYMVYDPETQVFTNIYYLLDNGSTEEVYYLDWYYDFVIQKDEPQIAKFIDELPYLNTFDTGAEQKQFTIIDSNEDEKTWSFNNGEAVYRYDSNNDADDWLISPGIKLEAGKKYHFAIDAYAGLASYPERLEVMLGTDATPDAMETEIIPATDITWNSSNAQTLEQHVITVDETGYYYFGIHAISDADNYNLYVDNFLVEIEIENDLSISVATNEAAIGTGVTATISATVTNSGLYEASGYTVTIKAGDKELLNETVTEALAPEGTKEFTAELSDEGFEPGDLTIQATVEYSADEVSSNNQAETSVKVLASNGVIEKFEDTETFPTFSVGGITADNHYGAFGDWTLYDATGAQVYTWSSETISYDNSQEPCAWQVFDPVKAGWAAGSLDAHSGSQYLMSMCVMPINGTKVPTDHWLISPMLDGLAQTISFYVRIITTNYGPETFEILTSTTDNAPENFTKLDEVSSSDEDDWAKYSFDLPAGTKYFAIRHTSSDVFAMFIDDVMYNKAQ